MAQISERFDSLGADGAPAKLGIMGGTFDPIHVGHLNMAAEVAEQLGLDAVLFVPTGVPVFKRGQEIGPAEDRLAMCKLATAGNPLFDVSAIEIEREGDTYTVDTLRQMRAHYPDNVTFYLITGSDSASAIGMWRGAREIASLAKLVAVTRPDFELDESQLAGIAQAGFYDVECVETTLLAISSSDIRRRVREGREARYLVPPSVWDYICAHGLYGIAPAVNSGGQTSAIQSADVADENETLDPLSDEFCEARLRDLEERVSAKRLAHIRGVAQTCVQLAREYGLDERKARLAGVLHDWDKGYDDAGIRARVHELGMEDELDPWVVQNMPQVLHGQTAAVALGRTWPHIPHDVLQAVYRHTTATTDMSDLDKVLYIADALEPSRQFGRIDELRALVGTVSLDELYFATYEYWVFLLFERRKPLHPDTIRIWNDYTAKRGHRRDRNG